MVLLIAVILLRNLLTNLAYSLVTPRPHPERGVDPRGSPPVRARSCSSRPT